jgi:hypothetical protein
MLREKIRCDVTKSGGTMASKKQAALNRIQDAGEIVLQIASGFTNGFVSRDLLPLAKERDKRFTLELVQSAAVRLAATGKLTRLGRGRYLPVPHGQAEVQVQEPDAPLDADEQILNQALASILELTKYIHRLKHRNRNLIAVLSQYAGPVSVPRTKGKNP